MKDIGTWLRERTLDEKVEDIDWVMEVSKYLGKVELLKELEKRSSLSKEQISELKQKTELELDEILAKKIKL
jgi:hypothetical protein